MASSGATHDSSKQSQVPSSATNLTMFPLNTSPPPLDTAPVVDTPSSPQSPQGLTRKSTVASIASTTSTRIRAASIKLMEADPPPGMWAATSHVALNAPSLSDIRSGSFSIDSEGTGSERRGSLSRRMSASGSLQSSGGGAAARERPSLGKAKSTSSSGLTKIRAEKFPSLAEEEAHLEPETSRQTATLHEDAKTEDTSPKDTIAAGELHSSTNADAETRLLADGQHSNHYRPPPKLPWTTSTLIGLRAFWAWFLTPAGFLITLYGLNVVAWGGMLFLLLCNAAPAMCKPTCNDINSPRRIWIEVDSQILNALFCVTAFGLAPWRFRDLWWWAAWRLGRSPERKNEGIRRLAGIHRGWFRLPGSDRLEGADEMSQLDPNNPAVPIPLAKLPDEPLTGVRAPPTDGWKMDFVIWCNVWNTFLQVCLCGFMWGMNRFDRPSWSTGLFVALACIVAGVGGIMIYVEGKRVKKVEGVPAKTATPLLDEEAGIDDTMKARRDSQSGSERRRFKFRSSKS